MERTELIAPLSQMQLAVVTLLGLGYDYGMIAVELGMDWETVRFHAIRAARKIPGDLPTQIRCIAWARGASFDVLDGSALRLYVVEQSTAFAKTRLHPGRMRRARQLRTLAQTPTG